MKNKQLKTVCNFLHFYPVKATSLTGCRGVTSFSFLPSVAFLTECRLIVVNYNF